MSDASGSREPARGVRSPKATYAFAAFAAALFALAQLSLWNLNPLWIDEYFSIWASDPAQPFASLFTERILPDSNPPLYFSLLALVRLAVSDPRAAFLLLNVAAAIAAAAFVWRIAVRADLRVTGLSAVGLFLLSGAALAYAPEGRAYFMAMCCALAIAFAAAAAVERGPGPRIIAVFATLGALAALAHVFAGLFAGSIGAALAIEGVLCKRRELWRAGLALGGAATATFAMWFLFSVGSVANIGWVEFTPAAILEAVWYVRQLTLGPNAVAVVFASFLLWSALRRELWPLFRLFAIATASFTALPLLASQLQPIIVGRYWLIGAPAIFVFAAFVLRTHVLTALAAAPGERRGHAAGIAIGVIALAAALAYGYFNARRFIETKPAWQGAAIAREIGADCPPHSIHVTGMPALYAAASGLPANRFLNTSRTEERAPADGGCPLLAWAEHVRGLGPLADASDADLLAWVQLSQPQDQVRIVRHATGFVVLRPEERDP